MIKNLYLQCSVHGAFASLGHEFSSEDNWITHETIHTVLSHYFTWLSQIVMYSKEILRRKGIEICNDRFNGTHTVKESKNTGNPKALHSFLNWQINVRRELGSWKGE